MIMFVRGRLEMKYYVAEMGLIWANVCIADSDIIHLSDIRLIPIL